MSESPWKEQLQRNQGHLWRKKLGFELDLMRFEAGGKEWWWFLSLFHFLFLSLSLPHTLSLIRILNLSILVFLEQHFFLLLSFSLTLSFFLSMCFVYLLLHSHTHSLIRILNLSFWCFLNNNSPSYYLFWHSLSPILTTITYIYSFTLLYRFSWLSFSVTRWLDYFLNNLLN